MHYRVGGGDEWRCGCINSTWKEYVPHNFTEVCRVSAANFVFVHAEGSLVELKHIQLGHSNVKNICIPKHDEKYESR
jgi:hypothetical protein